MPHLQRLEKTLAIVFGALLLAALVVGGAALTNGSAVAPAAATAAAYTAVQAPVPVDQIAPSPKPVPPQPATPPVALVPHSYIEVTRGCGPYFQGDCLNVRAGPGLDYPAVGQLRDGMVLQVAQSEEADGHTWYKVVFDEAVRYPDRISKSWWVAGDYVRVFTHTGAESLAAGAHPTTSKRILVDLSAQTLTAYDGDTVFMRESISSGLDGTPTPRGQFTIFNKTPSRYMQGPLPGVSEQYYDLPGVPWDLYFTQQGAAIHGAYWHDKFGEHWSHGCVNLPVAAAEKLYDWADLGTPVTVQD